MSKKVRWPAAALVAFFLAASPAGARAECEHIDDPFQIIDIRLEMDPRDWDLVRLDERLDESDPVEVPATFRACEEGPRPVRVRRKVGDLLADSDDRVKVSLKIDFDDLVPDADWHGHRKLGLEAGRGLGRGMILREAFAWRVYQDAGLVSGTAAWVRVFVNGQLLGVYARVEEVDKSYLRRHVGEDEGFLYKLDYRSGDKRRRLTREGEPDPYAADLCYLPFDERCDRPSAAHQMLPFHLDLNQMLLFEAINALLANFDSPFFVDNNYFWYNSDRPRLYFPWDLDLSLLTGFEELDPYRPAKPSEWSSFFVDDPDLRAGFERHLARLVDDAFPPEVLEAFLDRLLPVIGPAIDADPRSDVDISLASEVQKLRAFLRARAAYLRSRLPAGARDPYPVVINEVLASNRGVLADESGRYEDWVELYNRGAAAASLLGLYLTNDPAEPGRWRLPDRSLDPGERLLVWLSRDDTAPLHTGFQLDADGQAVGLYEAPDRGPPGLYHLVDFVRFGPQEADVSLGRFPDGAPGFVTMRCPTPGAVNQEVCAPQGHFVRGDSSGDGQIDLSDAISTLSALYLGGRLACADAADFDDDGAVELTDVIDVLAHLFVGGSPPAEPRAGCGLDPTPDELGCGDGGTCG